MIKTIELVDREPIQDHLEGRYEVSAGNWRSVREIVPVEVQQWANEELAKIDQTEKDLSDMLDNDWREIASYPTKHGVKIVLYKRSRGER